MTLADKYTAKSFEDIKGQDKAIAEAKKFYKNFPSKKKALMLHGPAGTGKTTMAYCLSKYTDSEIVEMNASDLRNKKQIKSILGASSQQKSLFNENKIILVDEVDGICRKDYGAIPEMIRLIKNTSFPIIITANDPWDKKLRKLRKKTKMVELKPLGYKKVLSIIKKIAEKESIEGSEDLLKSIAIKSKGDVRSAINDLQTINKDTKQEDMDERYKEDKIFNILKQIFQDPVKKETLRLYDRLNMPLDKIFLWVEENIPREYEGEELYKAFDRLSKADVFKGRIYRQQHWRFLVYENALLSAGISSAKNKPKKGFTKYKKPGRILKIWISNRKQKHKKSIAEKYAKLTHISTKKAMRDFGIIKEVLRNKGPREELDLNEKEEKFLNKIISKK